MNYPDGQEVMLGDRVKLGSDSGGIVLAAIDRGEFSTECPAAQWSYLKRGAMIKFPSLGLVHYEEAEPDLELLARASGRSAAMTDDKESAPGPVMALAAEYETAALAALDALEHAGAEAQMAACIRFGEAMAALRQLAAADLGRVNTWLLERQRIPDYAWRKIVAAMQDFARG